MKFLHRTASAFLMLALAFAVTAGAWWLVTNKPATKKGEKPTPAATVARVVKEDDLNSIVLTEEAEHRLGLKTGTVEKKTVRRVRVYGGEVTIPVGRAILVAAPVGGMLKPPMGGVPKAGQVVRTGQTIFQLHPILSPEGRATVSAALVEADGQVNNAKAQLALSKIAHDRARRVLQGGAGSQRQVDEAYAALQVATKTLDAAIARRATLAKAIGEGEDGTPLPIAIDSPEDGILRVVSALAEQTVPVGAALFEVVDLSTVWIRVPLPVGDLDDIDRYESARVGKLSAAPGTRLMTAKPVPAPPSANPLSATVDLYYALPNVGGGLTSMQRLEVGLIAGPLAVAMIPRERLIPGQRLGVSVPLMDARESLVVPWSAMVFDVHGGTWVYEQVGPRRYVRRRVVVRYTVGENAVLERGPAVGARIVTEGVLELFGAETGFVK